MTLTNRGLREQIGKRIWCSKMDCNNGVIMTVDADGDPTPDHQCRCGQVLDEILALINKQIIEARIDELNRVPNRNISALITHRIERLNELRTTK